MRLIQWPSDAKREAILARYDPYSRRRLRARFVQFARRNTVLIAPVAVAMVAGTVLVSMLLHRVSGAAAWYLMGALHVVVVSGLAYGVGMSFLAIDREAILHVRGAWGEDNTRGELRRARRRRLIWGWVDSVTLETGDIDHLVVTREGGVLAIDSKWRNEYDPASLSEMVRAAERAKLRAEGLMQTLLVNERGSHRARARSVRVQPVVVLWGGVHEDVPEAASPSGIPFVAGRRLVRWMAALDGQSIDRSAAKDLLTRLEAYRASAWKKDEGSVVQRRLG